MTAEKCRECFVGGTDSRLAELTQAILRATDPYTAHHQDRVAHISMAMGRELKLSECQLTVLFYAGLVHDMGKVAIPLQLLTKPSSLMKEEVLLLRTHVKHGVDILSGVGFCEEVVSVIAAHHERLDGTGYPAGVSGDRISMLARILSVADVFEAMTSHRPYRPSKGFEAAMAELRTNAGRLYDKDAVAALESAIQHHPGNGLLDSIGS